MEDDQNFFELPEGCLDITKDYDPNSLGGLRQPRPNDHPPDLPPSFFTFDDAFEDLLSATFHGQVMDIAYLAYQRLAVRVRHPNGEPPHEQVVRLAAQFQNLAVRRHNSIILGTLCSEVWRNPKTGGVTELVINDLSNGRVIHRVDRDASTEHTPFWNLVKDAEPAEPDGPVQNVSSPLGQPRHEPFAFPKDELELADASYNRSPSSHWPSPLEVLFDTLLPSRTGSQAEESAARAGPTVNESSEQVVVSYHNGLGHTEKRTREYIDEKGRRIRSECVREHDADGNTISETTRRFKDGKERDVYDEDD